MTGTGDILAYARRSDLLRPLAKAREHKTVQTAHRIRAAARDSGPKAVPKQKVLVVEDNLDLARMMAILVRDMGFDVRTAADGSTAMEAARSFAPEFVLLDIVLPDMDGCQLGRELRALPGLDAIRIFAITAYDDDAARVRAVQCGCNGYFLKPISPMVLAHLLSARS
jgi:DNA-binding response OmpR family regulator